MAGIRSKGANIFVYVLLGLLVLGLAGFGVGNFGGNVRAIGTVGEVEIGTQEYARRLEQELRRLQQQTGQSFTMAQARSLGIDRSVLQGLVAQAALDDHADALGISVGDEAVGEQIVTSPSFQSAGGSFDRETYKFVLSQAGLEPAEYEELVRRDTARGLIQTAVANAVEAPATYADTMVEFMGAQRDFEWARLDAGALESPVPAPTDEEIQTYYDAHPEAFTLAEAKRLTYAWVTPNMIVDTVETDEAELKSLYEARIDEYQRPERRLAERLIFGTTEEAEAASARLQAGEITFEELVAERGLTLEDIDLGEVAAEDLSDSVAKVLFAMDEPGVTGPVESDLGPAIFRVNGILEAQNTAYEDVRDELLAEYAEDRARRRIADLELELEDLLAGGATLEELAKETAMELGKIDLRDDSDEAIAGYDEFRAAAAAVEAGDFPEVTRLSDGGIFALRLDETVPSALRPLDEVRDEVVAAWTARATLDALRKKGEALLAQLRQGKVDATPAAEEGEPVTAEGVDQDATETADAASDAAAAEADADSADSAGSDDQAVTGSDAPAAGRATLASLGVTAYAEEGIRRDAFIEGTPPALVETAFRLAPGESDLIEAGQQVYLVVVTGAAAPDEANPDIAALRESVQAQASQGMSQDLLQLYTQAVLARAEVALNQASINAVHAQFP